MNARKAKKWTQHWANLMKGHVHKYVHTLTHILLLYWPNIMDFDLLYCHYVCYHTFIVWYIDSSIHTSRHGNHYFIIILFNKTHPILWSTRIFLYPVSLSPHSSIRFVCLGWEGAGLLAALELSRPMMTPILAFIERKK